MPRYSGIEIIVRKTDKRSGVRRQDLGQDIIDEIAGSDLSVVWKQDSRKVVRNFSKRKLFAQRYRQLVERFQVVHGKTNYLPLALGELAYRLNVDRAPLGRW